MSVRWAPLFFSLPSTSPIEKLTADMGGSGSLFSPQAVQTLVILRPLHLDRPYSAVLIKRKKKNLPKPDGNDNRPVTFANML